MLTVIETGTEVVSRSKYFEMSRGFNVLQDTVTLKKTKQVLGFLQPVLLAAPDEREIAVYVNLDADGVYTAVLDGRGAQPAFVNVPTVGVLFTAPNPTVRGGRDDIRASMIVAVNAGWNGEISKLTSLKKLGWLVCGQL